MVADSSLRQLIIGRKQRLPKASFYASYLKATHAIVYTPLVHDIDRDYQMCLFTVFVFNACNEGKE